MLLLLLAAPRLYVYTRTCRRRGLSPSVQCLRWRQSLELSKSWSYCCVWWTLAGSRWLCCSGAAGACRLPWCSATVGDNALPWAGDRRRDAWMTWPVVPQLRRRCACVLSAVVPCHRWRSRQSTTWASAALADVCTYMFLAGRRRRWQCSPSALARCHLGGSGRALLQMCRVRRTPALSR